VVSRIDDAMVLAEQFFARLLGDLAEFIVDVVDDAALFGDGNNRRFVESELDVG